MGPDPPRGLLPPEIREAARTIHREVWNSPYVEGEGPMHHAGGRYWHDQLLRQAARWEHLARAARIAATWLPDASACPTCGDRGWTTNGGSLYDGSVEQLPCPDCVVRNA